jgi:hypothetical protein
MRQARQERYRQKVKKEIEWSKKFYSLFRLKWNDDKAFKYRIISKYQTNPERIPFIVEYFDKTKEDAKSIIDKYETKQKSRLVTISFHLGIWMMYSLTFLAGIGVYGIVDLMGKYIEQNHLKQIDATVVASFLLIIILFWLMIKFFTWGYNEGEERARYQKIQDEFYERYFEKGDFL